MREKIVYTLAHQQARDRAVQAVLEAPDGVVVEIRPKTRTSDQNALLHVLCGAIAKQRQWAGRTLTTTDWKRLLVDAYLRETNAGDARVVPSLDGLGVVSVGEPTRTMSKRQMVDLIDWISAWCAEAGVETGERVREEAW